MKNSKQGKKSARFLGSRGLQTLLVWGGLILFGAGACITVNVYFPESAVQKAADDFVRDLYKGSKEPATQLQKAPEKSGALFDLITSAVAAEEVTAFTSETSKIKERMAARLKVFKSFMEKGILGENNQGLLEVRMPSGLSLKERADLEKKIKTENEDRQLLFDEFQKTNHLTDHNQNRIKAKFSKAFQNYVPAGTWIQNENGEWVKK